MSMNKHVRRAIVGACSAAVLAGGIAYAAAAPGGGNAGPGGQGPGGQGAPPVGASGATGASGPGGPPPGASGANGSSGATGASGPAGPPAGAPGASGASGATGPSGATGGTGAPGGAGGPQMRGGPMDQNVLHGVLVRKTSTGTETDDVQTGTVTDVSATSITVKSSDGYTATYAITSSTKKGTGTIASGDTVHVQAVESGDAKDASSIFDGNGQPPPGGPKAPASTSANA